MIKILTVGKIKDRSLNDLIAKYQKKINNFHKIEIWEVVDEPEGKNIEIAIDKESNSVLKHIKEKDFVVLLDLKGNMLDSLTLARQIDDWQQFNLCFVIGGSNGVNQTIKDRADYIWKLSDLTFPHQLTRLLLLEQIYRSFKIIKGQNYHK